VCTAEPPESSPAAEAIGEVNEAIGLQAGEEQQWSGANAVQQQPLVRIRVPYARSMLVVVAAEGVAALRFSEPFELNNDTGNGVARIDYEWRFLAREKDAAEKTGSGRVFVRLVDGKVAHGSFGLDCGTLDVKKVSGLFFACDPKKSPDTFFVIGRRSGNRWGWP